MVAKSSVIELSERIAREFNLDKIILFGRKPTAHPARIPMLIRRDPAILERLVASGFFG
jgi:hypothetical protein